MLKILFSKSLIKTFIILAIFLLPFFALWLYVFAPLALDAATSPDAIAFRVMPNPDHLSPLRWYQENIKLKGAPQGLTVDGYEAVRDGRTVYVNAANIDVANNKFYTNIYIISYNQQAEDATVDIFGQILAHWKFNTNISEPEDNKKTVAKSCLYSSECPSGEYCLSQKAKIIRDTKRLADLADIKLVLENYKAGHNGDYPNLSAGSYLANKTISVWPSWQAALAKELGVTLPVDPVNKLGACTSPSGYDPITCWDSKNKKFFGTIDANNRLILPSNSRAYVYSYLGNKAYKLCALIESNYTNLSADSCYANDCTATCSNCQANAPAHSQPDSGACCDGKACYKCSAGYSWNGTACACSIKSCAVQGKTCGSISDTCGGTLNCGLCTSPMSCGGTGTANVCGCTPSKLACGTNNCESASDGCGGTISCGSCVSPQICPVTSGAGVCACSLWGEVIPSGQSVPAYKENSVACGLSCASESRVCASGILSGSYANKSCGEAACSSCIPPWGGALVADGDPITAFKESSVACGLSCSAPIARTCNNGAWSGDSQYKYQSCAEDVCGFTLSGNVKDALTNSNIYNAAVLVQTQDGTRVGQGMTNNLGNFTIMPPLPQNSNYKIVVTKTEGYAPGEVIYQPGGVLSYAFNKNQNQIVQLYLSPTSNCGDGVVTAPEVCDTGLPPATCDENVVGIPSYCSAMRVSGTKTCNDCTSWNACNALQPIPVTSDVNGYPDGKKLLTNGSQGYACCELTACNEDRNDCCGFEPALLPENFLKFPVLGYVNRWTMNATFAAPQVSEGTIKCYAPGDLSTMRFQSWPVTTAGSNSCYKYMSDNNINPITCYACGQGAGCSNWVYYGGFFSTTDQMGAPYPITLRTLVTNIKTESCRVSQGTVANSPRNWYITTNHAVAYYQCWK